MIRLLMIALAVYTVEAWVKPRPACQSFAAPVDEFNLDEEFEPESKLAPADDAKIYESVAHAALEGGDRSLSDQERSDAKEAREELKEATGVIIVPWWKPNSCPKLTNSYGPVDLCPSTGEYLRRFRYKGNKCYVLFPYWQKAKHTRCLCRNCNFPCVHKSNYCVPPRRIRSSVWAICRTNWSCWKVQKVTLYLPDPNGNCNCYAKGYGRC